MDFLHIKKEPRQGGVAGVSLSPVVLPGRRNTRSGREAGSTLVLGKYDRGILKKFTGNEKSFCCYPHPERGEGPDCSREERIDTSMLDTNK